jgi:hypothetical protein
MCNISPRSAPVKIYFRPRVSLDLWPTLDVYHGLEKNMANKKPREADRLKKRNIGISDAMLRRIERASKWIEPKETLSAFVRQAVVTRCEIEEAFRAKE